MEKRNVPKRDGSGKGNRANRGRGGCRNPEGDSKSGNKRK